MAAVTTGYEHIVLDKKGHPIIQGSRIKVINLIMAKLANDWSAEELQDQYSFLTLGQIYSALGYYSDHREEMDEQIEADIERVESLKRSLKTPPLIHKLKAKGLI